MKMVTFIKKRFDPILKYVVITLGNDLKKVIIIPDVTDVGTKFPS